MSNDRPTQTFVAALLLVAAVLVAMNRAVTAAPLGDWWLAGLLAVAGIVVAVYRPSTAPAASSEEQLEKSSTSEALPPATTSAALSASSAGVSARAKPDTPAAPQPSHVAKTEHATPEQNKETQSPPAPPPDVSKTATPKTAPEAQVVMEATAAAPQPHETEMTGEVTPETASKVARGKADETPVAEKLTKKASRKVAAQETSGAATAGKPDDLLRIDGIGPKIAAALLTAGIDSFQKLANTSEAQTLEILRAAKVRVIANYTTWPQQASYAARGDWEGLDRFNSERKTQGGD
jgi:predicted flap endonuclease-1-like 5' DNA nuclease